MYLYKEGVSWRAKIGNSGDVTNDFVEGPIVYVSCGPILFEMR